MSSRANVFNVFLIWDIKHVFRCFFLFSYQCILQVWFSAASACLFVISFVSEITGHGYTAVIVQTTRVDWELLSGL